MAWLMRQTSLEKQDPFPAAGPVVIGGLGGSGTRLVASVLVETGFYLGRDLNESLDNLWFTLLFKRPRWYKANFSRSPNSILKTLDLFRRVMLSGPVKIGDPARVLAAALPMIWTGHGPDGRGRGIWPLVRVWRMLATRDSLPQEARTWGWKEPNTHIYLEHLIMAFPQLRYIHVVRHGLDMALSRNQQQLMNCGFLFGLKRPGTREEIPRLSLKYWVLADKRVAALGETLGQKFLKVNFDLLCLRPRKQMEEIASFLALDLDEKALNRLCSLPRPPDTLGRYRKVDLGCFDEQDIEEVENMGFEVERGR